MVECAINIAVHHVVFGTLNQSSYYSLYIAFVPRTLLRRIILVDGEDGDSIIFKRYCKSLYKLSVAPQICVFLPGSVVRDVPWMSDKHCVYAKLF